MVRQKKGNTVEDSRDVGVMKLDVCRHRAGSVDAREVIENHWERPSTCSEHKIG